MTFLKRKEEADRHEQPPLKKTKGDVFSQIRQHKPSMGPAHPALPAHPGIAIAIAIAMAMAIAIAMAITIVDIRARVRATTMSTTVRERY